MADETSRCWDLIDARRERGWSQEDLARRIRVAAANRGLRSGASRNRVWRWEAGRATPDPDSQLHLANVFGISPEAVAATVWPLWLSGARSTPLPITATSTVPALQEALTAMHRRSFLAYSRVALTGLALDWAVTKPPSALAPRSTAGQRVDDELLHGLEETAHVLNGLATRQRQHTGPLLDAHLRTVTDLLANARYTSGQGARLHLLAAGLATTVGWHQFDSEHHGAAGRYWHSALHAAHAAGDTDRGAGIISDLAYQCVWRGDPRTATSLLRHALSSARNPTARSLLHLRLARALAALGEAHACREALTAAERLLGAPAADPTPAWCHWMSPADFAVDSSAALAQLGDARRASQLAAEGLSLLPSARDKTRAVVLAETAAHDLRRGQVDQAAAHAQESFVLASRIGAPRCIAQVRSLGPAFKAHSAARGVPELLALIDPAPAGSTV